MPTISKLFAARAAIVRGWKGPTLGPCVQVWLYPQSRPQAISVLLKAPKFLWELKTDQGAVIAAWEPWPDGHTLTDFSTLLAPWNRPRPRSTSPYHAPDADDIPF